MKKRYVLLITFIILIVIVIVLSVNNINKKTYVYEVDISGNDIMLKDFIMISSNNSIFIPNTYYFEKVGNSKVLGELFFKNLSINPND